MCYNEEKHGGFLVEIGMHTEGFDGLVQTSVGGGALPDF